MKNDSAPLPVSGIDEDPLELISLPFAESVGYQVRLTNRLIQKLLQQTIEPYGVSLGMWYFLRALWHEDGLTQRQLSVIIGTTDPTALSAIKSMERSGFIERKRNAQDNRKINIHLTQKGLTLKNTLLPLARQIVHTAVKDFSEREFRTFLQLLSAIRENIRPILDNDKLDPVREKGGFAAFDEPASPAPDNPRDYSAATDWLPSTRSLQSTDFG